MRWIARNSSGESLVYRCPTDVGGSSVNRLKKVQGKKKRVAAITAAEKQAAIDAEKQPVKLIKTDETQPQNTEAETVAERVAVEGDVTFEEVTVEQDAVEETVVAEPEVDEATVNFLSTKDEDVIF